MSINTAIRAIQLAYPQIWFACHVAHRARQADDLSDREAGVLAHIEAEPGARASDLARHLGIGQPTLSAQLKRLHGLGLIAIGRGKDARERTITLTARGREAVAARSPLDAARVQALLEQLSTSERRQAVKGLNLLADAARRVARAEEATRTKPTARKTKSTTTRPSTARRSKTP